MYIFVFFQFEMNILKKSLVGVSQLDDLGNFKKNFLEKFVALFI